MSQSITSRLELLSDHTSTLYLVAGVILVVHAIVHGIAAFTAMDYPLVHGGHVGPLGYTIGFIALLSLYPRFKPAAPKLALAIGVLAVLGAVGWVLDWIVSISEYLGITLPQVLEIYGLFILAGFSLGYLISPITNHRTGMYSTTTTLALLTPVIVMIINIGGVALGYGSPTGQFVVSTGFAIAHLLIGAALRNETTPPHRSPSGAETPV